MAPSITGHALEYFFSCFPDNDEKNYNVPCNWIFVRLVHRWSVDHHHKRKVIRKKFYAMTSGYPCICCDLSYEKAKPFEFIFNQKNIAIFQRIIIVNTEHRFQTFPLLLNLWAPSQYKDCLMEVISIWCRPGLDFFYILPVPICNVVVERDCKSWTYIQGGKYTQCGNPFARPVNSFPLDDVVVILRA